MTSRPRVYPRVGGETSTRALDQPRAWVYPRVGGETQSGPRAALPGNGLSPRGRGNRSTARLPSARADRQGLSPRGRGNRQLGLSGIRMAVAWVYPRVGGETDNLLSKGDVVFTSGVYPRVGGETPPVAVIVTSPWGLSPRGRGNPSVERSGRIVRAGRSIPAWAGKPRLRRFRHRVHRGHPLVTARLLSRVYPRVGGETASTAAGPRPRSTDEVYPRVGGETTTRRFHAQTFQGLSPRGRGNLAYRSAPKAGSRSIPAGAGEPMRIAERTWLAEVYPRGCGGTRLALLHRSQRMGLSPRVRGNHQLLAYGGVKMWSIPAGAGEPFSTRSMVSTKRVYPRGCGGTTTFLN